KTVQNLKSLLFEGYKKLPKASSISPFSCGASIRKGHQTDRYYTDFCNEWECELEKAMKIKSSGTMVSKEPMREEDTYNGPSTKLALADSPLKKKKEEGKEEKNKKRTHSRKGEEECPKNMNEGDSALEQKMKELERMDVSDMEHVLD